MRQAKSLTSFWQPLTFNPNTALGENELREQMFHDNYLKSITFYVRTYAAKKYIMYLAIFVL